MIELKPLSLLILVLMLLQQPGPTTPTAQVSSQITARKAVFPGLVEESDRDCPVVVSAAECEVDFDPTREMQLWVIRQEVRLENRGKVEIRKVLLGTSLTFGPKWGGYGSAVEVSGLLPANGSRVEINRSTGKSSMETYPWNGEMRYNMWVVGVEYADGSHWAAPRTYERPLFRKLLTDPAGPIGATRTEWAVDSSFKATLEIRAGDVVAYRLGVMKDTPDGFEAKVGRLVELSEESPKKGSTLTISSADAGASIGVADLYAREVHRFESGGQIAVGVALFFAEVHFADGRVWRRSLKREDLLWNVR